MSIGGSALSSFKFKLVDLLPAALGAAGGGRRWGFTSVAAENEAHRVDARLQAGLRIALAAYQQRIDAAAAAATALARDRAFQVALQKHDRAAIAALLRTRRGLSVRSARVPRRGARAGACRVPRGAT